MMRVSSNHRGDHFMDDNHAPGSYVIRLWGDDGTHPGGAPIWIDFEIHRIGDSDPVVVSGFAKWDGCTQFHADVHIDAAHELEQLCAAIVMARRHAADLMGSDIGDEYG